MEFMDSIDFVEYLPIVGPNGLFPKRNRLLYEGNIVKSMDLIEIISLLNPDVTNKFTVFIERDKIKVDFDKEKLMEYLPKTEIKMVEIYKEYNYYTFKKKNYSEAIGESKSYLFYLFDEYESYAAILFLIHSDTLVSFDDISKKLQKFSNRMKIIISIIQGICYGYPRDFIRGYYITRYEFPPLNLFNCIQARNITKKEKDLFYQELKEFENSELYASLSNQFDEDYINAEDIIDDIISSPDFKGIIKNMKQIEQKCTPDYVVV